MCIITPMSLRAFSYWYGYRTPPRTGSGVR
jgi:hypothetical protein